MVAAIEGHDLAVEQLLIKGARLDICDKDDRSVVFHAAKENQGQVLKRLLGSAEGRDLIEVTGKSFSEALILASVNPQYDKRLFTEFPEKYKFRTCCVQILF